MGYLTVRVDLKDWGLSAKLASAAKRAEHAVAVQVENDTEQYVPKLNGMLRDQTQVKGNLIIYPGPYARYLYYGKVMVNAATGKGPSHYVDKDGNEKIRFPKGVKLKPTERNLKLDHPGVDPNAQSHWFEASKAQNLDKWKRVAAEAMKKYD